MVLHIGLIWAMLTGIGTAEWQPLAPGIDLCFVTTEKEFTWGDGRITVVRIDPGQREMVYAGVGKSGSVMPKTAREWCDSLKLTATINAGMFNEDYITHTGYARYHDKVVSNHTNSYKSLLAFEPKAVRHVAPFRIFDLDEPGTTIETVLNDYRSVIQNLRLIKKPGINVWNPEGDAWSEAAIGEDNEGRILFIFCQSPYTMHDLNNELLNAGIGIVAAQHLEGGPYAQFYLNAGGTELDLTGSDAAAWAIPNVIGIRKR